MFETFAKNTLGPLVLRFGLAVMFVLAGLGKVSADNDWGASWGAKMPDPPAAPLQVAVAWGELIGGLAVGLGLLTRVAALGLTVIMIGAIITVTGPHGFLGQGGYATNFLIITMCAALMILGPGKLAVDHVVFRRRPPS